MEASTKLYIVVEYTDKAVPEFRRSYYSEAKAIDYVEEQCAKGRYFDYIKGEVLHD